MSLLLKPNIVGLNLKRKSQKENVIFLHFLNKRFEISASFAGTFS